MAKGTRVLGVGLRARLAVSTGLALSLAGPAWAGDLPAGGQVAAGSASIASGASSVLVTQGSQNAVIDWQGFSVGAGNSVTFVAPNAQSATLNRVTGAATSVIAGQITGNGAVYLVNPNGIAITSTGSVQTGGGFVASTLDIADADFMAGKRNFAGSGASKAVTNAGGITAGQGAYVALLGGAVANSGTISVPLGKVGLGSGESIALDLNGDGFMQVAVPTSLVTGSNALVLNSGAITAAGGRVSLKAATVVGAVRNVIEMPGSINADSASGDGGGISLIGGADTASMGGTVTVSGSLSARALGTGNGGQIETSGEHVNLNGAAVSTLAAEGKSGTWTIDPNDFTIAASGGDITGAQLGTNLAGGNVIIKSDGGATTGSGNINVNDAVSFGSASTLTLDANHSIYIDKTISVTGGGTVSLVTNDPGGSGTGGVGNGDYNFLYGASIDFGAVNHGAALNINNSAYTLVYSMAQLDAIDANNSVDGSEIVGYGAGLSGKYALATNLDATGTTYTTALFGTNSDNSADTQFGGTFDGIGHTITGLTINGGSGNFIGLVGYNGGTIRDIGIVGGSVSGARFVGGLVAENAGAGIVGHATAGDTVTAGNDYAGGLVGLNFTGTVIQSSASGSVRGATLVGGLVGRSVNGLIQSSSASGTVTGSGSYVGGLIGTLSGGTLNLDYATGAVDGGNYTGGLVGYNDGNGGSISNSYATGAVSGHTYVGGLLGKGISGIVSQSYAQGAVSGGGAVGGLIGANDAAVSQAYATGSVTGTKFVGGIAGENLGSIDQTYASGAIITGGANVGGVAGYNGSSATVSNSYWDTYSTGQAAGVNNQSGTVTNVASVSSDPAASTAYAAGTYANFTAAAGIGTATPSGWVLGLNGGNVRPLLAFEVPTPSVAGNDGYGATLITSAHQLALLNYSNGTLQGNYSQAGNIDLGIDEASAVVGGNTTYAGIYQVGSFSPIGIDANNNPLNSNNGFAGTFDGHGFSINGLIINTLFGDNRGLFGYSSGTIRNVNLTNVNINANGGNYVGALVGRASSSSVISGSSASGSVSGVSTTGGLVGQSDGAITQSSTNVVVTANGASGNYFGGLLGFNNAGTVTQSHASGSVTAQGNNSYVGGLIGFQLSGITSESYATGAVNGGSYHAGGLLGRNDSGTIIQSYASGAVSGNNNNGGLAGDNYGTITQSYATGSVTGTSQGSGGLVGINNGSISQAYATGAVGGADRVGGLVGSNVGSIDQTYASGAVSGSGARGGLVGGGAGAGVTNSAWDSFSSGIATEYGDRTPQDATVGAVTSDITLPGAANYAYTPSAYTGFAAAAGIGTGTPSGWVFLPGRVRPLLASEVPTAAVNGADASGAALINSGHQLALIDTNGAMLSGSYALAGNVDLTNDEASSIVGGNLTFAGVFGASGFLPIGTDGGGKLWNGTSFAAPNTASSIGFSGKFNGGSYTLNGLSIYRPGANFVGLFGESTGAISNLTVSNAAVAGGNSVGALVGLQNGGTVSLSKTSGSVSGGNLVGGLVGNQYSGGSIANSSSNAGVAGLDDVGGLVGYQSSGVIAQSSATGAVTGSGGTTYYRGGLVGYSYNSAISDSFATGSVNGNSTVGGLIGKINGGSVTNSYATGVPTATNPATAGGLIGEVAAAAAVISSYWDTTTSGTASSAGGTGYTTAQLQDGANYTTNFPGWNFVLTWTAPSSGNYPTLKKHP